MAIAQSQMKLKNLKVFAKTYGYVKYFHPSDEASAIDWNMFAIYGAKKVMDCKTPEEMVRVLSEIYHPIAPTVSFSLDDELHYDFRQLIPPKKKGYKPTYWQHMGVAKDMVNPGGVYRSIRVNRKSQTDLSDGFGGFARSMDAGKYAGKKVKLQGDVKINGQDSGTGHLWLRVDKTGNVTDFIDNMADRPIRNSDWHTYEVVGKIDSDAQSISFGGFLSGKGTMLVDNMRLFYHDAGKWQSVDLENGSFEDGFEAGKWKAMGKGYKTSIDGDDQTDGKRALSIHHVGYFAEEKGKSLFKSSPKKNELWMKDLGQGIRMAMPIVLYTNRIQTFPKAGSDEHESLKNELKGLPVDPEILAVRLGNMINCWNVFQHFYPYFEEVGVDWDLALEDALKGSFTDAGEKHIMRLEMLTAKLKDGHVRVNASNTAYYVPPFRWEWVEGQLIITKVFDPDSELRRGDRVTHIEGEGAETYFEEIRSRISAASEGFMEYRAASASLFGKKGTTFKIRVNGTDHSFERVLHFYDQGAGQQREMYKILENGIIYLNLDLMPMDSIRAIMPRLTASNAIIADLRGYPTGNNHILITHLLSRKDKSGQWMQIPQFIYPDRDKTVGYVKTGWKLKPHRPYLGGKKVFFLIDGSAISYAESYMGLIEGYGLATIVGQPTAGTNGNINVFTLPGGYNVSFTGMKVVKNDGSQHHGIGIQPHVYVEKTIEGIKAGRDEFLEKAIELANE